MDWDKFCKITFDNYFSDKLDTRKIEDVPLEEIPNDIDLLAAGFPCQPFSLAGHKKGFNDPRGKLFDYVAKIIDLKRPKAFLLEKRIAVNKRLAQYFMSLLFCEILHPCVINLRLNCTIRTVHDS